MKVVDLAEAIAPGVPDVTGIRPGEKLHEILLTEDESRYSVETGTSTWLPEHPWWTDEPRWLEGNPRRRVHLLERPRTPSGCPWRSPGWWV